MPDHPQTPGPEPFDIFVSHATEDLESARRLAQALGAEGYRCFIASDHLNAAIGTREWTETLEALLTSVPILVLVVTDASLGANWVKFEWRSFHRLLLSGKRSGLIVPVVFDQSSSGSLPLALDSYQRVDYGKLGERDGVAKLLELVDGFRAAAQGRPDDALYRQLRWSRPPSEASPQVIVPPIERTLPRSLGPARGRSQHLSRVALMGAASLLAGGIAYYMLRGKQHARPPSPQAAADVQPSRAIPLAASSSGVDSLPEPRRGWKVIELYLRPTIEKQNLLRRAETWLEARTAFEAACRTQCTPRQRAAGLFAGGQQAWLEGSEVRARAMFEEAAKTDPDWSLPLVGLATTLVADDPQLAVDYARQASMHDPQLWVALTVKAAAFIRQKDYLRAIQEYKAARLRAPRDCHSLIDALMALTYHHEGRREEKAKELALLACTQNVHWASACAVLAERAIEQNNPDEALGFIEVADRDDFIPLLMAQGDALQLKGELERAWIAWRRVAELQDRAKGQGAPRERLSLIVEAVRKGTAPPRRNGHGRTKPGSRKSAHRTQPHDDLWLLH